MVETQAEVMTACIYIITCMRISLKLKMESKILMEVDSGHFLIRLNL